MVFFQLQTAFEDTPLEKAIVKQEVYAFRRGSLFVHFRIYLNRKKMFENNDEAYKSYETIASNNQAKGDLWISEWIQHELKEGIGQLRVAHADPLKIDLNSVEIIPQHYDPILYSKESIANSSAAHALERSDVISNIIYNKPVDVSTEQSNIVITEPTVILKTITPVFLPSSTTKPPVLDKQPDLNNNPIPDFVLSALNKYLHTTANPVPTSLKPTRYTRISNVASRTTSNPKLTMSTPRVPLPLPNYTEASSSTTTRTTTSTTTTSTTTTSTSTSTISSTSSTSSTSSASSTSTTTPTPVPIRTSNPKRPRPTTLKPKPLIIRPKPQVTTAKPTQRPRSTTERPIPTLSRQGSSHFVTVAPIPPHHKPPPGTMIKVSSVDYGQWRPLSPFSQPLINQGQPRPAPMMPTSINAMPRPSSPNRNPLMHDTNFPFNRPRPMRKPEIMRQARQEMSSYSDPDRMIPVPILIDTPKMDISDKLNKDFDLPSSHLNFSLKDFIDSLDVFELSPVNTSSAQTEPSIPKLFLSSMNSKKINTNVNPFNQSNLKPFFNIRVINNDSSLLKPPIYRKSRKHDVFASSQFPHSEEAQLLPLPNHSGKNIKNHDRNLLTFCAYNYNFKTNVTL